MFRASFIETKTELNPVLTTTEKQSYSPCRRQLTSDVPLKKHMVFVFIYSICSTNRLLIIA